MSYCVNCGVELEKTEKKCPLCGVPVLNPAELPGAGESPAYPERRDLMEHAFDRHLWIQVVSVILAVPAVICLVANLLVSNTVTWSPYVIGALAVVWMFCVSPFLFKRYFPLLWIIANTLATLGYLYLIEALTGGAWFLPLSTPIVLGVAVLSLILLVLIQRGVLKDLYAAAGISMAVGLLTMLVELSIGLYATGGVHLMWSWYSLISCAAMAAVLGIIERRLRVKEELKRRLHI